MDQEAETPPTSKKKKYYVIAHAVLRLLASIFTLAAAIVTLFNRETKEIFPGFFVKAAFKQSTALEFFLAGNAVACGYSLVTLPFVSNLAGGYLLHLLDMMMMSLMMASASAATVIGYLAKVGEDEIGWSKVCFYYERFCNRAEIALGLSYVGFFIFLSICALSHVHNIRQSKIG